MRFYVFGPRMMGVRPAIGLSPRDFLGPSASNGAITGAFVYVVRGDHHMAKIGVTTNPAARLGQLRTGSAHAIDYAYIGCTTTNGYAIEGRAHAALAAHRRNGEWFDVSPQDAIDAIEAAAAELGTPLLRLTQEQAEEAVRLVNAAPRRPRTVLDWYLAGLEAVLVFLAKAVVLTICGAVLFGSIFLLRAILTG